MPPIKKDFDLTDKGWVDSYVKKCESILKEFTSYVYALQNHCVEERSRSEQLENDCKSLQTEVAKLNKEQVESRQQCNDQIVLRTPDDRQTINRMSLGIKNFKTPTSATDADRTTISDGSPAFLNMAMDSEQLQIDTTCILSPAQHRQELVTVSEQLSSPTHLTTTLDSIFQQNSSPTCKTKHTNNENKSALGFLKARGRVGKTLHTEMMRQPKLVEHNCASSEDDNAGTELGSNSKGKLQAKNSDWLGKHTKSDDCRAALKRASTSFDDIQRKRALLSLNKSSERKLKQSRLTQLVSMKSIKIKNGSASTSPEDVADAQKLIQSPTTADVHTTNTNTKKQLPFPSFSTDTADIFHFSSDDEDDFDEDDKVAVRRKRNVDKPIDATFLQPLPRDTEMSESVLAITPTAPPIICLDESECNEMEEESVMRLKSNIKVETTNSLIEIANIVNNKRRKSNAEKLPNELAAAMLAEWEEEVENEDELAIEPKLQMKTEATKKAETKPRLSLLPVGKISIKEYFNIDCAECQKYIDFMGCNMNMAEVETHLRRCKLHHTAKDCIPSTPPGYWNPLMPSFSDSDPRNKTLQEDPYLQRKRSK